MSTESLGAIAAIVMIAVIGIPVFIYVAVYVWSALIADTRVWLRHRRNRRAYKRMYGS